MEHIILFVPSLMFRLFEQLLVLMLAHLLFAPLDNVSHTLTSFYIFLRLAGPVRYKSF